MAQSEQAILQKTLTANDVGKTGSHQAGIHVPQGLAWFFPPLSPAKLNPDAWLQVTWDHGTFRWRWIHYNNRLVASGTRDEYRLTHTAEFIRAAGARVGDSLELHHLGESRYQASVRSHPRSGVLVLSTAGAWKHVAVAR